MPGTTETALAKLQLPRGGAVLDLGCYQGDVSRSLLESGYEVSSCDHVAYAGTASLPDFRIADANHSLPFRASSFDAVLCTEVIEHLDNPSNLLREISRVLKSGGTCVLSTPNVDNLFARFIYLARGHFPLFGPHEFKEWGHISPISFKWLNQTAAKSGLSCQAVTSEPALHGWKRRLFWYLVMPFLRFQKNQTAIGERGHSIIVQMRKI